MLYQLSYAPGKLEGPSWCPDPFHGQNGEGPVDGPGNRIRTCDIQLPKLERYQTALYPDDDDGGGEGDRTLDLLRAKQMLSQLSYAPIVIFTVV